MSTPKYPRCLSHILDKITPDYAKRKQIASLALKIKKIAVEEARNLNIDKNIVEISYQGSYAKDTWLPDSLDLDLFILFKKSVKTDQLAVFCKNLAYAIARRLGFSVIRKYATHPYYTLIIDNGIEVDIVPAYYAESSSDVVTPVDRTQLHTRFVKEILENNPRLKDEIRLFKKLLKSLEIYGAEIKIKGFSGYLAEVLIIHYGSLSNLLFHATKWRPFKTIIGRGEYRFNSPLVVIDPVDPKRNVAAAVSLSSMAKLIAFSVLFGKYKDLVCCVLEREDTPLEGMFAIPEFSREYIAIKIEEYPNLVEESLMGYFDRIVNKIIKRAGLAGFDIYRSKILMNDNNVLILLHMPSTTLPRTELHVGPSVWNEKSVFFLKRWISEGIVYPYVYGDRWVVIRKRDKTNIREVINEVLNEEKDIKKWAFVQTMEEFSLLSKEKLGELYRWITGKNVLVDCLETLLEK